MNLIDESYNTNRNNKKILIALGIGIIILIFIIVALVAYVSTSKGNKIKLVVDTKEYNYEDYLLNKDNINYIWIEGLTRITPYNGYSYKSGDKDTEDENKCYVTNNYESTFFKVGSNKIYKVLEDTNEMTYYTLDNPIIKAEDGKIYMPINASKVAMNTTFNDANNIFTITSIGYLESYYNQQSSATFNPDNSIVWDVSYTNKKLLKDGYVIIKDDTEKLGLATVSSSTETKNKSKITTVTTSSIITPKYDSIEYVERYNQLIVESENGTKGIVQLYENNGKETVVAPQYGDIRPINEELFIVTEANTKTTTSSSSTTSSPSSSSSSTASSGKDNNSIKYGIVGLNEKEILPIEYKEIGIDISKFTDNDIDNRYILYDSLIPVKKDKYWGFVNLSGKEVIKMEYDDLGCTSSNASGNVLIVPELNAIIVKKGEKYGVITKNNLVLVKNNLVKVFKEEVNGKEEFNAIQDNKKVDLIKYVNSLDSKNGTNSNNTNSNNTNSNNTNSNNTNSNNTNSNSTNKNNSNSNTDGNKSNG